MAIATINPTTGETLKTFEELSAKQIETKLQLAASTFETQRRTSFVDRARSMTRAAEILETEKQQFGKLMTIEMGKPIKAAISEAEKGFILANTLNLKAASAELTGQNAISTLSIPLQSGLPGVAGGEPRPETKERRP